MQPYLKSTGTKKDSRDVREVEKREKDSGPTPDAEEDDDCFVAFVSPRRAPTEERDFSFLTREQQSMSNPKPFKTTHQI